MREVVKKVREEGSAMDGWKKEAQCGAGEEEEEEKEEKGEGAIGCRREDGWPRRPVVMEVGGATRRRRRKMMS